MPIERAKIEQKHTARVIAQAKAIRFTSAIEEHLGDALKEGDVFMADLYQTLLDGIRESKGYDRDGKMTITLDLAREIR